MGYFQLLTGKIGDFPVFTLFIRSCVPTKCLTKKQVLGVRLKPLLQRCRTDGGVFRRFALSSLDVRSQETRFVCH